MGILPDEYIWIQNWKVTSVKRSFLYMVSCQTSSPIAIVYSITDTKMTFTDSISFKFNSLAPGRFQRNFSKVIFQLTLVTDGWRISCKIVLKWIPMDFTDGKSTLVQVMAWCHQATSHYLSQCWPRSLLPYGITRPQWQYVCKTGIWYY